MLQSMMAEKSGGTPSNYSPSSKPFSVKPDAGPFVPGLSMGFKPTIQGGGPSQMAQAIGALMAGGQGGTGQSGMGLGLINPLNSKGMTPDALMRLLASMIQGIS
jgi:hypothetical protein